MQLQIEQLREELSEKTSKIESLQVLLAERDRTLTDMLNSVSWRITAPLRRFAWLKSTPLWKSFTKSRLPEVFQGSDYDIWMKMHQLTETEIKQIRTDIEHLSYKPTISILMPVYNIDEIWLRKAIESVVNQLYPHWELCIADDGSPREHIKKTIEKYSGNDRRIKAKFLEKNQGMANCYNEALRMAGGEFVGTLDHDDELTEDALYENAKLLNRHPHLDMIYSDEDKIDLQGKRSDPFFKPDYSPDLLLSMNYICHFTLFRRSVLDDIGGFRSGFDGSQDYDVILRFVERTASIAHIPKILYHWRKMPGSAACEVDSKPYAFISAKKTLGEYLVRNHIDGTVVDGSFPSSYRVKRTLIQPGMVSIIVPFRDKVTLLEKCVKSILQKTNYPSYEILLVNNQSSEATTINYLATLQSSGNIRIVNYDKDFNFSAINNEAVRQARGEYVLLLNNDTEVISDEWLNAMVEHAQRKEVGIVGAKLLYPNGTIQHAGVVMGLGIASHAFKHLPSDSHGYFGLASVIRNYSAVTGACMLMRKEVYEELGGLDEENFRIAYNDVDMCLRAIERGYKIIYTPYALLYHYESISRGDDNTRNMALKEPDKFKRIISERIYMVEKWQKFINSDPFYNPNLTRIREDFRMKICDEQIQLI